MRHVQNSSAHGLGREAAGLELVLVLATLTLVAGLGRPTPVERGDWVAFLVFLPLVAVARLLGGDRANHRGPQPSLAPFFAAVVVLPPSLFVLLAAVAFVPEWLRTRSEWYVALVSLCNYVAPALLARAVFDAVDGSSTAGWTLAATAAIVSFVALHHGLLAAALRLARGVSLRDTVRLDSVVADAGLLSLGAVAAALWGDYPGLAALTLLPMALAYRSLAISALVEATRIEPKSELDNARHLRAALGRELERAARFDRSVALLMIDVDHLRDINTARGHLAGDRALAGVASALRDSTREYDVAARFGGDEFCVLLPETGMEGAMAVAERMRSRVEELTRAENVPVTVSIGVVAHHGPGPGVEELIAAANTAAYQAKASGRNAIAAAELSDPVREAERVLRDSLAVD